MSGISVVIPVLNERQSLPGLIERLSAQELDSQYIFVDDGSTDGSKQIISNFMMQDNRVLGVFNEKRLGHMGSYLRGIEVAIFDNIVLMDADLQHPPEMIRDFRDSLNSGYEIVIGSRYKGRYFIGKRDKIRGLISRVAELIMKIVVTECRRVSDPLSGFIGFKKTLAIPVHTGLKGNKLLPFLLVANRNAKVTSLRYLFSEREVGESKIVSMHSHFILKFFKEVIEVKKMKGYFTQ